MTENEAKKWIRAISATQRESNHTSSLEVRKEALYMAIQALEEIQQYKAIGTIEEFKALKEKAEIYEQAFLLLLKDDCKRLPKGWTGSIDELYVGRKQYYLDKVDKAKVLGKIKI